MSAEDARNLAAVAVLAIAPVALVWIVALLRGYQIDVRFHRPGRRRRRNGEEDP